MSFKILSPVQKVLKRPARVIGDIKTTEHQKFTFSDSIKNENINYNPGLGKIIREIIDNSIDEFIRTNGAYSDKIDIVISDDGYISVKDNGRGIPIKMTHDHEGREILIPEAAWTRIDAGSNFDDHDTNQTAGQNGEGAALTNIFSVDFKGETTNVEEDKSKTFTLHCTNNLSTTKTDVKETKRQNGTIVEFLPDYERFGVKELPKGNIDVLNFELLHIGMTYPGIKFTINGKKLVVRNLKDYASLYNKTNELSDTTGLKLVVMPSSSDNFEFIHFINGLNVFNGGTPMNWVTDNIVNRIHEKLVKKYKSITKGDIKSKLFLVSMFNGMYNPRFADQIKSQCVNNFTDFKSQIELPDFDKLVARILKCNEIIDPITEVYKIKEELKKRQELKGLDKTVKKIKSDKYTKPIGSNDVLLICEGLSAKSALLPGLGRQGLGYYELKGKPANVYSADQKKFTDNKELSELYKIIKQEGYKRIAVASDSDLDGLAINGLLIAFFKRYLMEELESGMLYRLNTPVMALLDKNKVPKEWIYDLTGTLKEKSGLTFKYFKGLGSWTPEQMKEVIKKDGISNMLMQISYSQEDDETIDDWYSDKKADKRKEYILNNDFDLIKL